MLRLASADRGLLVNESSVVAIDTSSGTIVDLGETSWRSVARDPRHIVNFRPLSNGTTVDFDVAARLLRAAFDQAAVGRFSRLHVTMSIPALATPIERRAIRQAALQAGATEATLVETPLAAAVGASMALEEPTASPVVMIGGGATEVALMSLGGIVVRRSIRVGGTHFDSAIADTIRQQYGVVVSLQHAENLKIALASAVGARAHESVTVPARTVDRGEPVNVTVPGQLVDHAMSEHLRAITRTIVECLGEAPPDLAQDVSLHGLRLVGGSARLHGIDVALERALGVAVSVHPDPELVVISGLRHMLRDLGGLHRMLRAASNA